MSVADDIRARMKHTRARLKHIGRVQAALKVLQRKRKHDLEHVDPVPQPHSLSVFGIDYAWGKPDARFLKRSGVKYVMRYLSHDASKNLSLTELRALREQGIKVGVVWESTASRALGGYNAGVIDARTAKAQADALGLKTIPVYFAVDFDATDAQKPTIARYLNGASSVLGPARVGVYGGYYVVKYMANMQACRWFWQTYAWSGGQVHPSTHIYQYSNGHTLDGVSCDYNHATNDPSGFGAV